MNLGLYLPPFLLAFGLTVFFLLIFLAVPFFERSLFRRPGRRPDRPSLSRLGGTAMLLGFTLTFFLNDHLVLTRELLGMLVGLGAVLVFGLWDDLAEQDWKTQLFFQLALGMTVYLFGIRILSLSNPWGGAWFFPPESFSLLAFLILFLWLLGVMNSLNWLDGLDGLAGGVALTALVTIFFLSLTPAVNQPPIAILSIMGGGAVLGFLFFNVSPAKIVAGTVGSMFLGFLIAVLAVIAGTKIATALLVLSLPIADSLYVLMRRYRARAPLFQADHRHLHYRLRELGWSEGRIAWFFFLSTALVAVIALSTQALGKLMALLSVLTVIFILLFFVEYQVEKKKRLASHTHNS